MICQFHIAHYTLTLGEFIAASTVVKGLVTAQVRQLCLFLVPKM